VTILYEIFDDGKFSTPLIEGFDLWWSNGKLPWLNILRALDHMSVTLLFTVKAASAVLQTEEAKMGLASLAPTLDSTAAIKVIKCLYSRKKKLIEKER